MDIENWLNLIQKKEIINLEIEPNLSNLYNKITNLNYLICFDIEFIRYVINQRQVRTIHELGGILFIKKNNKWILYCIFHFNLIPIINNINQYYLLTSDYNTVSDETYKKLLINEKELFTNNKILNKYKIKNKKKIKFMIKGYDLFKMDKEYELFKQNIKLILNDPDVINRQIKYEEQNNFIKLTNKIFSESYLIVKGLEDIKALKNHSSLLKLKYEMLDNYYDIAVHNDIIFKKCNSAELEKSYQCLDKLNLTKPYDSYLKIIEDFTKLKAHNPLVDAYYTWVIFNILKLDKF
jgi:hypothetical protein